MKKKLFALALCVIMVVALAVPAFAAVVSPYTTGSLYAWRGAQTGYGQAGLIDNGRDRTLTVVAGVASSWEIANAPQGSGLVIKSSNGIYVNIYRVNQGAPGSPVYYNATGWSFDYADGGRDQIVTLSNYGNATSFRLANANLAAGGNWFLCTDASSAAASTSAIWYNGTMTDRFFWSR